MNRKHHLGTNNIIEQRQHYITLFVIILIVKLIIQQT